MDFSHCVEPAERAAQLAAREIRAVSRRGFTVVNKGTEACNAVTEADKKAERVFIRILETETGFRVISEERDGMALEGAGPIDTSKPLWVIDPLDGSYNFSKGIPLCATSAGLWYEGKPQVAVVKEVFLGRTFTAVRGQGTWRGNKRCRVSCHGSIAEAVISHNWPIDVNLRKRMAHFLAVAHCRAENVRELMSCVSELALVADGAVDGHVSVRLWPWDGAAVSLLITEAGGTVTDMFGKPWTLDSTTIVGSNGRVHDELVALIQESFATP